MTLWPQLLWPADTLPPPARSFSRPFSWLTLGAELRGRSDSYFGWDGLQGENTSYYLHRLRLNAEVRARRWLRFVTQWQDSRVAGYDHRPVPRLMFNPSDLRQAYVEFGGAEAYPWTATLGRQPLVFGDTRLVSTSNWGNVGPNFDAARITFRNRRLQFDAFSSMVVTPVPGFDHPNRDRLFSGLYSSFDVGRGTGRFDAYLLWKKNRRAFAEEGLQGHSDLVTYGIRTTGRSASGYDYTIEVAAQAGHIVHDQAAGWATHWEAGYRPQAHRALPRTALELNVSSGDSNPHDGRRQTFDPLYPTNVYGTAADFGWSNLREPVLSLEWSTRRWRIRTAGHAFWLNSRADALYTLTGTVFVSCPGARHNFVGTEWDTRVIYQRSKFLQFWLGYANLFPGAYLREAGRPAPIRYPYLMWTVTL